MKKFITLFLSLAMVLTLAACGNGSGGSDNSGSGSGDASGGKRYKALPTKEEVVQMLYNLNQGQ